MASNAAQTPAAVEYAAGARKVLADEVATPFQKDLQAATAGLGVRPKLVGFLANTDPAAQNYAKWTEKAFKRDGLDFELRIVAENDLEEALEQANVDDNVHGIMIYYPVFGQRPSFHGPSYDDYLRDTVSPFKDVEGLCHFYRRSLYRNRRYVDDAGTKKCVLPCTPLAVVKTLEHLGAYDEVLPVSERMRGKTVTVVNRSEVVGRPLAAMLANDGATVYSIDIDSIYIFSRGKLEPLPQEESKESIFKKSDVVILGVPSDNYRLDVNWVKEDAIVLNVASHKNIDEQALLQARPGVRYVPQVGKVTVAMLERNLLRLYDNWAGGQSVKLSSDAAMLALSTATPTPA
mmetsp:Transcript_46972/g.111815  ORF Transcript_46972/g.111815 Transcript_46972/m.111815 type:complete len:347 (-) Transcript_46972:182-1222(-)